MFNWKLRCTAVAVLTAFVVGVTAASTSGASSDDERITGAGAGPGIAPPDTGHTAVYLDQAGQVMDMSPRLEAAPKAGGSRCTPISGRDNPHVSQNKIEVSGHGWWKKGNCSSNRAKVFNCLYDEYFTDRTWRQQACSPTKVLKPGGGSTNRTVARVRCQSHQQASWRNHVEVDVIDELDTGEKPMNQAEVACRRR